MIICNSTHENTNDNDNCTNNVHSSVDSHSANELHNDTTDLINDENENLGPNINPIDDFINNNIQ